MNDRHNLKILKEYFEAQLSGAKNFEFRKHDRDFKVVDHIVLHEIETNGIGEPIFTGRKLALRITYVLASNNFNGLFKGIEDGYCVLGTRHANA